MPPTCETNDTEKHGATLARAGNASYHVIPGTPQNWERVSYFPNSRAAEFAEIRQARRAEIEAEKAARAAQEGLSPPPAISPEKAARLVAGATVALETDKKAHYPAALSRHRARCELADYLERVVLPACTDPYLYEIPARLRAARVSGVLLYRAADGRMIRMPDSKAELALLCPDDAREEGGRVYRRYGASLKHWTKQGRRVYALWFTRPHAKLGELRPAMRSMMTDAKSTLDKFKAVKGSLFVMECPLSAGHRWNVHINALVCTDGSDFDFKRLHDEWSALNGSEHTNIEIELLEGGEDAIAGAVHELIKYAARAISEKSAEHHARDLKFFQETGRLPAPPMVEWPARCWLEWFYAHQRFRRTRTYGVLYKVGKPPKETLEGFVSVGSFAITGFNKSARFTHQIWPALIDSIQGYNFFQGATGKGENLHVRGPPDC